MDSSPLIPDAKEPFALFDRWFADAAAAEPGLPEAMSLATSTADGKPSVRMVLLKEATPAGFVFYTNAESRKGEEIMANPHAALCFYWKSLNRQIRVEGKFEPVTTAESDAYFASRVRGSQIAAWASDQSRPVAERRLLVERLQQMETRFASGAVPRPPHWRGFRLVPEVIEFWHDVPNRLHDRLVFRRAADGWRTERLYP